MSRQSGRTVVWDTLIALSFLGVAVMAFWFLVPTIKGPPDNVNVLAIGPLAKFQGSRSIGLLSPVELDGKTKEEVLALRAERVSAEKDLMENRYRPFKDVFKYIEDRKPWWGLVGEFYYGPGKHSIDGPSEESRFLMNPYLLVAADFVRLRQWDRNHITTADLQKPDFPLVCLPDSLRWNPADKTMDVDYPLSEYTHKYFDANGWKWNDRYNMVFNRFDVIAYNARDFDLNYAYIDPHQSPGISTVMPRPIGIPHYLHCGGSCRYPGGCNNMSPPVPGMDDVQITQLPATCTVSLWKKPPTSSTDPPDMTCRIHLR